MRGAQGRGENQTPSNDPLAELARLIGQNDPFGEYGREQTRPHPTAPAPAQATTALQWDIDRSTAAYSEQDPMAQHYDAPAYAAAGADRYHEPGLDADRSGGPYAAPPEGQDYDLYDPNSPQYAPEDQDFYDDVPRSRRRTGVLAIAGIFALAVVGTAGAFGYRAMFGSSGSSGPPPVIKADTTPSKVVPASAAKSASTKLITDRVNDGAQPEKLVSREEKPVDIADRQSGAAFPTGQVGASPAPLGSGVVGGEPKKVRTIAIHPDGTMVADAAPSAQAPRAEMPAAPPLATMLEAPAAAAAMPPARAASPPPVRVANHPPAAPREAPRPAARPAPVVHQAAPAASHAPLSLSPDAPAPRAPAPTRTASVAPTQLAPAAAQPARAGGYAVQVSSQRSEAEAKAAFHGLQGKFPKQLGGQHMVVHRVDLGAKGIYFRALVGPFASAGEAGQLCSSLKSAGGQCIVQKN